MDTRDVTRRNFVRGIAGAGLALSAVGTVSADAASRYVVVGRAGAAHSLEREGYAVVRELAGGRVLVVEGDGAPSDVGGVRSAVPNRALGLEGPERVESSAAPTDEDLFSRQWDKQITDVPAAHKMATGVGTSVAIIDTGVDYDHPDLAENVDVDAGRLFREGEVLAGKGEITLQEGSTTTEYVFDDVFGHGSHVAGIAAGSDDGTTGISGTAPDAAVLPLRVFYYTTFENTEGETRFGLYTTDADILAAIDYAARRGADVMNMSLGTPPLPPKTNREGFRQAYRLVITHANASGTVVVVSAGNADADLQHGGYYTVPNSVSGAMSVSATGPNDERTFYSNHGTNEISIGAPGGGYETLEKTMCADYDGDGDGEHPVDENGDGEVDGYADCDLPEWPFPTNLVLSSVPPELYDGSYYAYFAGTSMAAPQVAGVAALVRQVAPDANVHQVEQAVEHGATGANGKGDSDIGAGVVNAKGALDALE